MNILHVSSNDLKGGRFTGYYMNEDLDLSRHKAEMAVGWKESNSPHVHHLQYRKYGPMWVLNEFAKRMSDRLSLDGLLVPIGSSLLTKRYFKTADVIHLQLLHARPFFSLLSLPRLTRLKPTVWTIHDSWAMTGQCLHAEECDKWLSGCHGRCPHPRGRSPIRRYMARPLWEVRHRVYGRSNLSLVAASSWVEDRLRRSPLLSRFPIRRIPFGVDLNRFESTPTSRNEARRRLSLDPDAHVIAFRGLPLVADKYKGCALLLEALELYEPRRPTYLFALQDAVDFLPLRPRYKVLDPGWLDGSALADAYAAADVFVMPSTQEAFGLMAVEAMACGTPVITFEGTAVPEVIQAPRGGLAVPMKDTAALAGGIDLLLGDEPLRLRLGRQARELAEHEYSSAMYVERHMKFYGETIERFAKRPKGWFAPH